MIGWLFSEYIHDDESLDEFEKLFNIFKELIVHTSGDVSEAISWLTELDKQYNLTSDEYGVADFVEDLKNKGYIDKESQNNFSKPTSKLEIALRENALNQIFSDLKNTKKGNHSTTQTGRSDDTNSETKPYEYGDNIDNIAMSESIKNAHINHGFEEFRLEQSDIEVYETQAQSMSSTVLMIDISHSMILYGEDRITPAKKVAMALAQLITTRYPKDTLDIIVFGNDAWQVKIKDLPYLEVGPYHTNTVAGLELAMDVLRKRKNPNKQIFMITDGKPTCLKKGKTYYKNSFGLDKQIINRTLSLATKCRKLNIPVTTFMIARDPWLVEFVEKFTQMNQGKAYYSSLQGLGSFIFQDYKNNKGKNYR